MSQRRFAPIVPAVSIVLSLGLALVGACGGDDAPGEPGGSGGGLACDPGTAPVGGACVDIDECATDNGGCGDPTLFRCEDREAAPPRCEFDPAMDYLALVEGVSFLEAGGAVPSAMVVHGDTAFPVALDADGSAIVAAARVGEGRVVAYAHEAFLAEGFEGNDDRETLARNAVRWAGRKESPVVGLAPGLGALANWLAVQGLTVIKDAAVAALAEVDVFVTATYEDRPAAEVAALESFVAAGGGLVTGGQAWSSADAFRPVALAYPGNRLLAPAGIVVTDRYAGMGKTELAAVAPGPLDHATRALVRLAQHVTGEATLDLDSQRHGARTVGFAVDVLPIALTDFFDEVVTILAAASPPIPSEAWPIEPASMPIAALELHIESKLARELPASKVTAHAAAADFPGEVPADASALVRTLSIDASYTGRDERYAFAAARADVWRGTGLYARPGSVVGVKLDAAKANKGLGVRIGAHSDELWHTESWRRFPAIDRVDRLDAPETEIASAFGGLIYITVPAGAELGLVSVTIDGAVAAPRFVAGKTTAAEWTALRDAPAPWAELESDRFVVTLPSELVRSLVDPTPVLALWDDVLDASADLAAIPHARPRAERFVVDRQIGAGYMHSGYPIMAHLDGGPMVLDTAAIEAAGSWGPFHEIGHNHQWGDWVLPGTIESSVNLWSVYVSEEVFGVPRAAAHPALVAEERAKRTAAYLAAGAKLEDWQVWTALETYLELQEGFGWGPFKAVFAEYQTLSLADAPKDDAERIDEFCLRFGKAVGHDLGPFFTAWGLPLSSAVKAELATLPEWTEDPRAK